jgi:energy-coupling factor transporter ATP-binding protein EcfA2
VMTTHETDDILDLADQVIVLDRGKIVLAGTPAEVFSQPQILREAGVKIPDALDILMKVDDLAGDITHLTDAQIHHLDGTTVGSHITDMIHEGRLEVIGSRAGLREAGEQQPVVLEADHLSYQYPGYPPVKALEDITVSIRSGEMVGIVGQNGSGKSTLVKSFVGLLRPTRGEIRMNGKNISKVAVGKMARLVGLVLQNPDYQLFTTSCKDEILFGLKNLGIEGKEAEEKVHSALALVGLEAEYETFPFRMSFGDRRKLAVAATVALDPQVLILDEPTTAQDHRGRYQLAEIARKIRDEGGRTILMITHDMDLIAHYAERLIVMWNGKIILDGPTDEVFAQREQLTRTFLRPPVAAEAATVLRPYGLSENVITPNGLLNVLRRSVS